MCLSLSMGPCVGKYQLACLFQLSYLVVDLTLDLASGIVQAMMGEVCCDGFYLGFDKFLQLTNSLIECNFSLEEHCFLGHLKVLVLTLFTIKASHHTGTYLQPGDLPCSLT